MPEPENNNIQNNDDLSPEQTWAQLEAARAEAAQANKPEADDDWVAESIDDTEQIDAKDESEAPTDSKADETKQSSEVKADSQDDKADTGSLSLEERLQRLEEDNQLLAIKAEKQKAQIQTWMSKAHKLEAEAKRTPRSSPEQIEDLLSDSNEERADTRSSVQIPSWLEEERHARNEQTIAETFNQFGKDHSDIWLKGEDGKEYLDPSVEKYLLDNRKDYAEDLDPKTSTPTKVKKATLTLLREARLEAVEKRKIAEIEAARAKRAASQQDARSRKKASMSSTGSGNSTTTTTTTKKKDLYDLSTDELRKKLEQTRPRQSGYLG